MIAHDGPEFIAKQIGPTPHEWESIMSETPVVPEDLRERWSAVYNEVVALHARWKLYRQLFAGSQARIDVLNEAAANFFYFIHGVLVDDVQLVLSKLADPASTLGHQNLTLETLIVDLKSAGLSIDDSGTTEMLTVFRDKCKRILARRNKMLAHFDAAALLKPLEGPSREEIEAALAELRDLMNRLAGVLGESEPAFQMVIMDSDGDSLVALLKEGLRYEELLRDGRIGWNDLAESRFAGDD
jgi:hypothetical protein